MQGKKEKKTPFVNRNAETLFPLHIKIVTRARASSINTHTLSTTTQHKKAMTTASTGGNITAPCHFQEEDQLLASLQRACDNCGGRDHLMKCSRCHTAFFCSVKCQKTYWPFHRAFCRKNEFADATEGTEPKFARWMRSHGKQAVLKDGAFSEKAKRGSLSIHVCFLQEERAAMYDVNPAKHFSLSPILL